MMIEEQRVYDWQFKKYAQLVERTQNAYLKGHQKVEREYILGIKSPRSKTFIDVGAGYGRLLPTMAKTAGSVIAVEINKDMLTELRRRAAEFGNVEVVGGDGNQLSELLEDKEISNPVLLLLQNSLGTWEGKRRRLLEEMKKVAMRGGHGEIVISLFNQEVLKSKGTEMYKSISELVGEPDFEATDFINGIFRSKSGYVSKWWTPQEREEIRNMLGGQNVRGIETSDISIIHMQY